MRVVVDNDEGTAITGRTDDTPLRSTAVDCALSMLLLNGDHDVTCSQVALVQSVDCMLRPKEADEAPRLAARSDRCKPLWLKALEIDSLPWILV